MAGKSFPSGRYFAAVWIGFGLLFASVAPPAAAQAPVDASAPARNAIQPCLETTLAKLRIDKPDLPLLRGIGDYCYAQAYNEFMLRDFDLRRDKFARQDYDEKIMLWMVVAITIAGVLLAGLQILASYRLAASGRGEFERDSEVALEKSRISVKSSVTGLLILTVSFAFFMVFVIWVYTFKEDKVAYPSGGSAPAGTSAALRDLGVGGLGPSPGQTGAKPDRDPEREPDTGHPIAAPPAPK